MKKIIVGLLAVAVSVLCADMDWPTLTITAPGNTNNIADIGHNLKSELYALSYDANRTVMDFLVANFSRETMLNELLSQNVRVDQHYLTDGSVEYNSKLALPGKILAVLIPETKAPKLVVPMLCPSCGQEWPDDRPVPAGIDLVPKETESTEFTGIVIDCRNLGLTPALFPRVIDNLSEEVYAINFADPRFVIDGGLVLYSTSDVYNNNRIGYYPLRIQALGVSGAKMTDIKISMFDARRIHGSKRNLALLKECRVAIIFGP
ncbi:MAG TPA: hypothetical protein VF399_08880 [bacterium]